MKALLSRYQVHQNILNMFCKNLKQFPRARQVKYNLSSCLRNRVFIGISHPYSTASSMNVFDRKAKKKHRDLAASARDVKDYDYLKEECNVLTEINLLPPEVPSGLLPVVGNRVADRVYDITRKFAVAAELGCGRGYISKHLCNENVEFYYHCDMSEKQLEQSEIPDAFPSCKIVVDEEFLPFSQNSVDIFLSSLNFHWINDLPGVFQQIHSALKPDGVLIASLFGGETLFELRCSLQLAELEREGGFAPHISPFTEVRDLGDLLNRAGYSMLTIDTDEITVNYPSIFELMWDLKGMAENNASWNRKTHLHQDTLIASSAIYKELYGNEDGTIPATFQILYLIGWKPHESQAKPARRGSATVSMKDLSKLGKEK